MPARRRRPKAARKRSNFSLMRSENPAVPRREFCVWRCGSGRRQCGEPAFEIRNQIGRVFQSDVKTDGRAAGRPFGRGAVLRAVEKDSETFKAAPRIAEAEQRQFV